MKQRHSTFAEPAAYHQPGHVCLGHVCLRLRVPKEGPRILIGLVQYDPCPVQPSVNHQLVPPGFCSSTQQQGAVYSVACVANHSGAYSMGHYTATCRVGEKWYRYNVSQQISVISGGFGDVLKMLEGFYLYK